LSTTPKALPLLGSTARARAPRRTSRSLASEVGPALILLVSVALPLPYLLRFDSGHVVTATILALLLCGISAYSRRGGIVATAVFLAFLGDYRRYAGFLEGYPASDPLLLVGAVAAGCLFLCALAERRLGLNTGLAKLVTVLMFLMFFGMFNPLQGGLDVGFAGALFYLVPLLWFWIGRAYGTRELMEFFTFRVLIAVGLAATAWGLYQTYFGLFAFESAWVRAVGYGALSIATGVTRALAFFNSSAEYLRFLLAAAVALLAMVLAGRLRAAVLLAAVLLAIFLSAARGPVIMFVGAAVVMWSIKARSSAAWTPRFLAAGALGVGLLVALLLTLQTVSFGGRLAPVVDRQIDGLLDPVNPEKSTAVGHLQMVANGFVLGIEQPAGRGLGATTLAAAKYGGEQINAEIDFANVMIALGILGGLVYIAIVVAVLVKAVRWWKAERHRLALATVGIVVATFGGWLIGGEYSMAALVWFYIGAMDKLAREERIKRRTRSRATAAESMRAPAVRSGNAAPAST
jgi:hypothetical protein